MNSQKEVYFDQYCSKCRYSEAPEEIEPCCTCLEDGTNEYSHKPTCYKEKT